MGGRVSYAGPGVALEAAARALVAHEDKGYEEWGASASLHVGPGVSGRGLSLSVMPLRGNAGSGTVHLWGAADARGFAPDGDFEAGRRLEPEVGYGLPSPVGILTPFEDLGWRTTASAGSGSAPDGHRCPVWMCTLRAFGRRARARTPSTTSG